MGFSPHVTPVHTGRASSEARMAWTDAPTPSWARPASVGGPASTSGAPPADPAPPLGYTGHVALQDMLRDLLAAFYQAYLEDATEPRRRRMAALLQQADRHGLLGPCAVEGLAELFSSLTREFAVDPQRFAAFYHFFFFVARDRGHRNLADATAVEGWRFLLGGGRFALLEPWCAFVRERREGGKGVSEDTWCQVLDFAHSCDDARGGGGGCLDAYDPHGAWPVLVDEFVDHVRRRGGEGGAEGADEGADEGAVDDVDMDAIREPSASAVYNGGQAGGSGRGFGGTDRWSSRGGNSGGGSGDGDGRVPAVGCKRRLSAVLELDGLADQLERQARCSTPPVPAGGAGRAAATTANPTTGSPTRKFFRMDGRPA